MGNRLRQRREVGWGKWLIGATALLAAYAGPARATDASGTVQFQGNAVFAAPIAGIAANDLEISVRSSTEATANAEKCSILATSSDGADVAGAYPDAGTVSAQLLLERGGPNPPSGSCIVTVQARGTDGASVSARGAQTLFVDATTIGSSGTVAVPDITVRESKAVSGLDKDCLKWVKRQLKLRVKCNFLLLKKGPSAALKCKDAGVEPAGCDPGNFVEAILTLAHGVDDQQVDAPNAEGVDATVLKEQIKCQKRFGKAAANFAAKRLKLIEKHCVEPGLDAESCRDGQSNTAKKKLDQIDKCAVDQQIDGGTGRPVPAVGAPCDACIGGGGSIDRKCLKSCFQIVIDELSDGIMGDLPVCGDGILQPREFCDDGNTNDGDGCSSTCTVEMGP